MTPQLATGDRYLFLEELSESEEPFTIWRSLNRITGRQVLLKIPSTIKDQSRLILQLENELRITSEISSKSIIKPISMEPFRETWALALEAFDGNPMNLVLQGRPMKVALFLKVATELTTALCEIHKNNIVHRDLQPKNFYFNTSTNEVKITGFTIASVYPREYQPAFNSTWIEGTLTYMAPEQTGRMNRGIDCRSDLYSLGISFYQMLSGKLPFFGRDPLEWIHCHIAHKPKPLAELVPEIPHTLSNMIDKLLLKNADERYQSAEGLLLDLEKLSRNPKSFQPGLHDRPERFLIPQKIYGRETEIAALKQAFEHVQIHETSRLILISGYSGIGKSSLVRELQKPVIANSGFFISGKCDPFKRDTPYSVLTHAFRELIHQILSLMESEIALWEKQLKSALENQGQLMIDLIPELELIIGKQPSVTPLPLSEAQRRFHNTFCRFIAAFGNRDHPLVLFIDDLQWIDSGSLELLHEILSYTRTRSFLALGAYRENKISRSHPLISGIERMRKAGVNVTEVILSPLSERDLGELISDTVGLNTQQTQPLTHLIFQKTGGNPFFAIQFLITLYEEGLITYSSLLSAWTWDLDPIKAKGYSENIVQLLVSRIEKLSWESKLLIEFAACIGNRGGISILATLLKKPKSAILESLWPLAKEGLLMLESDNFRFPHDRVQQAAYSMIPKDELPQIHLKLGRLLLKNLTKFKSEDQIFEIVNHLNHGFTLIHSRNERIRLSRLNLKAAQQAKRSNIYSSAIKYAVQGLQTLQPKDLKRTSPLIFDLYFEQAEAEYLIGHFNTSKLLLNKLLEQTRTPLQEAKVRRLEVDLYTSLIELKRAIECAILGLHRLGIHLSIHPTRKQVIDEYDQVWQNLGSRSIEELSHLPLLTDKKVKAAQELMAVLFAPALSIDPLLPLLCYSKMVNLSLLFGNSSASSLAYAYFGMALGPGFSRYEEGYRFGKLGFDLEENTPGSMYQARINFIFGSTTLFWTRHLRNSFENLQIAFRSAVEIGDITIACYCCNHWIENLIVLGTPLSEVYHESEKRLNFTEKAHFDASTQVIVGIQRFIKSMRGETIDISSFSDHQFDDQEYETRMSSYGWPTVTCWYFIMKLQTKFISGEYQQAIECAQKAAPLLWSSFSHIQEPEYWYYSALAAAQLLLQDPETETNKTLKLLKKHQKKFDEWTRHCPDNFLCKYALISAELARIEKQDFQKTIAYYNQAIESAQENHFVQNEAIANELAGKYLLTLGHEKLAENYLREASKAYDRWGAIAKVRQLEKHYPFLITQSDLRGTGSTISSHPEFLDVLAVTKASQTISSEIELDRIIEKLMHTVLEQAGAEKGYLLLVRNHKLEIEAEATSDQEKISRIQSKPVNQSNDLPVSLIQYVERVKQAVILTDTQPLSIFSKDPYIMQYQPKTALCLPILRQAELVGVLYLENRDVANAFIQERLAVLELLASQAAISLENATLYSDLMQLSLLVKNSPAVLFRCRSTPGLPIDYVSENVTQVFGCNRETLTSGSFKYLTLTLPEDRETIIKAFQNNSNSTKKNFSLEYRMIAHDTQVFWVDARIAIERNSDGNITHYQVVVIDITERKRMDQALRESEARLRTILDHAGVVIFLKNADGKYLAVNPLFKQLAKINYEPIGKTDHDLFPPEIASAFRAHDFQVLRARKAIEYEEKIRRDDGLHTYLSVKVPLFDSQRMLQGICGISTDITARKRLEEERLLLIAQLQDALASRDEFISIASHELKTPLTPLKLQVQLIKQILQNPKISSLPEASHFNHMLEITDQQMDRLAKLINSLLDVSALGSTRMKLQLHPIDIVELIQNVVERLREVFNSAHCPLHFQACPHALVLADRIRFEQVIDNLLSNAMKYGAGKPVEVSVTTADGKVEIRVKDHGIGIAEKDQKRIFERFERAVSSNSFGGLGLGLYVSYQIVLAHHGRIRLESTLGQGTSFIVELPLI